MIEAWVEDEHGERLSPLPQHTSDVAARPGSRSWSTCRDPAASVYVLNEEHQADVLRDHRRSSTSSTGASRAGDEAVFSFMFDNVLAPGRYSPVITLAHRGSGST